METHAYSDRDQLAVQLSLAETLANAAGRGSCAAPGKRVVRHLVLTDHIWVEVEGQDDDFDPIEAADPRPVDDPDRSTVRGLPLARSFMDFVEHFHGGRAVLMSKRRGGMPAGFGNTLSAERSIRH